MDALLWIAFIAGGLLAGGIMFCSFVPRLITGKDICRLSDDGNPGAFNVFRHCGAGVGCLCLALDVLKGLVPVLLAAFFTDTNSILFAFVMLAPVLGHAAGIFNRMRGGKCIATSFGVMLGLIPVTYWGIVLLAALYIAFSLIRLSSNRVRSIIVYGLFAVLSAIVLCVCGLFAAALGCGMISLTAVLKHLLPLQGSINKRGAEFKGND